VRSHKEKDIKSADVKPFENAEVLQNNDVKEKIENKIIFDNETHQKNSGALADARSEINSSSRGRSNRRSGSAEREFLNNNYDRSDTRSSENEREDIKKHQQTVFYNEMINTEQSNVGVAVDASVAMQVPEIGNPSEILTPATETKKRASGNSSDEVAEYSSFFFSDTHDSESVNTTNKTARSENFQEPADEKYSHKRKNKQKERAAKLHGPSDNKVRKVNDSASWLEHNHAERLQENSALRAAQADKILNTHNDSQKRKLHSAGLISATKSETENINQRDFLGTVASASNEIFSDNSSLKNVSGSVSDADIVKVDTNSRPHQSSAFREIRTTGVTTNRAARGHKQTHSKDTRIQLDKPSKLEFDDALSPDNNAQNKNITHTDITLEQSGNQRSSGDSTQNGNAVEENISPLQAAADKKAAQAQAKANRYATKLKKAEKKLPKKHRLKYDKTIDLESKNPKPKRKLHFDGEVKGQADHLKGSAPARPLKFGTNAAVSYGHKKIYMVERENVGVEATHKSELAVESVLRRAYRRHKTKPYRKTEKISRKNTKLNARAAYRKAVAENPRLQKSFTSRMIQKRRIQRQYAKAVREGKKAGGIIKSTADMVSKTTQFLSRAVIKNPMILAVIAAILFLLVMISALFAAFAGIASGVGESIVATGYLAESAHIDDASIAYTEMEIELRVRIENIADEFPGYDEYRINAENIGHCPFELMAFLTATNEGFTYPEIRTILQELFDAQYQFSTASIVEIRHYLNDDGELIPYEWNVLVVTLTARPFSEVSNERMDDAQQQHFSLLMQSEGNRQYVGSPFSFDWTPLISSHYGWRIHPITGEPAFHTGIDIGLPAGTEILAAHNGVITFAGVSGGYGNFIIIEGSDGIITRYAHCDSILVTMGQQISRGDVIGTVGSTGDSTGPHLHYEVIKYERFLNPAFFAMRGGTQ